MVQSRSWHSLEHWVINIGLTQVVCILKYSVLYFSGLQSSNHINRVVSHPTLPVTITAHEDRHIKFFDNKTGKALGDWKYCSLI